MSAIDNGDRLQRIRALLTEAFEPQALDITDDSHRHVGHAGARDGRGHFTVAITSAAFEGMSPIARHRAIYAALGGMMETDIHALAIQAMSPAESRQ